MQAKYYINLVSIHLFNHFFMKFIITMDILQLEKLVGYVNDATTKMSELK